MRDDSSQMQRWTPHTRGEHIRKKNRSQSRFRRRLDAVNRPAIMSVHDDLSSHRTIRILTDVFYVLLFIGSLVVDLELLQWSVSSNKSFYTRYLFSNYFFSIVLFGEAKILILNLLLLLLIYGGLLLLFNHFWAATTTFNAIMVVYAVANHIKVEARNEPVLASDLTMATGNTGEIASFILANALRHVIIGVILVILLIVIGIVCSWYFGPGHILTVENNGIRIVIQILLGALCFTPLTAFAATVGDVESPAHAIAMNFNDFPMLWDAKADADRNGVLLNLFRGFYVKVIDEPSDYSKKTMEQVADRYTAAAKEINKQRTTTMTKQNVILILSESYSDPTRVPGIHLNQDPMPFVRSLKNQTTSGLMLSSGYGGGTANLEFQAITGLSTSNFNASLKSPYQQFVPGWQHPVSFNQLWNTSGSGSVAFHAADGSLYLRHTNYKKFGFSHFWTLDGPEFVKHKATVENNPLVSDASSYANVVDYLRDHTHTTHFIQMATIQNHMPYPGNYYSNNPFISTSTQGAGRDELGNTNTYSRGLKYTDEATQKFLEQIDQLSTPTTVVWYGDHLPGIYPNEIDNPKYTLTLHESDYFIWSNKATGRQGTKISDASYSSPNYFIAQAAEQMNGKASPYLAFLTRMHQAIPAMEPQLDSHAGTDWSKALTGKPTYVDTNGNRITTLTKEQEQLVHDYQLITYDVTHGNNYLRQLGFLKLLN